MSADGAIDRSFGDNGRVLTDAGGSSRGNAIVLSPDGRIVGATGDHGVEFIRYLPTGALDPSFGDAGHVLATLPPPLLGAATSVALQPDGRILVAGYGLGDGSGHVIVARYLGGSGNGSAADGARSRGQGPASAARPGDGGHRSGLANCVVPRLAGKRVRAIRRALARAHCRLGHVSKRRSTRAGRVISQRPRRWLRAGAKVSVTVGSR